MLGSYGGPSLLRRIEQPGLSLALLTLSISVPAPALRQLLLNLDLQSFFRQRLNDFESQKSEDIDNVIVGFAVCYHAKAGPIAETFSFAEGKGGLAAFAVVDVFVFGHVPRTFVGEVETHQRC